jgi:hypothetical protein
MVKTSQAQWLPGKRPTVVRSNLSASGDEVMKTGIRTTVLLLILTCIGGCVGNALQRGSTLLIESQRVKPQSSPDSYSGDAGAPPEYLSNNPERDYPDPDWTAPQYVPKPVAPSANRQPSIISLHNQNGVIKALASDPDDNPVTFSAVLLSGNVDIEGPLENTATSAMFRISPLEGGVKSAYLLIITAMDRNGLTDAGFCGSAGSLTLGTDALYAVSSSERVELHDSVRITVASGATANTFQYLNGCGVVCGSGAVYRRWSFDVGAPDDSPDISSAAPVDGIWTVMQPRSFMLAPQGFILGTELDNGSTRTDFNVTPLGGTNISASGLLFNFEYTCSTRGVHRLAFEGQNEVSRTYYQDSTASDDHFWGDISNEHPFNFFVVE